MKSEAGDYSIDDLERDGTTAWTGVRNYEARNLMRDKIRPGDLVLYYHSNANPSGVVGIAEVASEAYPDPTQFDPTDSHYDPKSDADAPRWWLVDIRFVEKLPRLVSIGEIRTCVELEEMVLVRKSRLSVQPVTANEFSFVRELARDRGR
jgi:predicted RNA-binding protein with PUA-like domain